MPELSAASHQTQKLTGDWTIDNIAAIRQESDAVQNGPLTAEIGRLDTAGALILKSLAARLGMAADQIQGLTTDQHELMQLIASAPDDAAPVAERQPGVTGFFDRIGRNTIAAGNGFADLLRFIGETTVNAGYLFTRPGQFRGKSVVRHIYEAGISAIPIVALIAFLISIVLAYQGSNQLQRFGAQVFTVNLVSISVLREMGVLLTAIMIAGRSGSAFTAEIGVMKVNEEIDAMRLIGVNPFNFLVLPRLIALTISMPLLTFLADIMGLIGGGIVSNFVLDIPPEAYIERVHNVIKYWDFGVGLLKAPVFGCTIAIVACMRGMQVTGSAESIGRMTTKSVVQSIFLVLLLDAAFSILFTKLGI